jgi:molybdopterin-binding protein
MLSVRQVSKTLLDFEIKDVSFEVTQGQYFVLLGASGIGKSVLLETIAGLIRPGSGRIFLDGKDITEEKIQMRGIGLVFQNSTLFPHMTVYDNIAYPLRRRNGKLRIRERVGKLAEDFGVSHLLRARPPTLSGGEAQRVSLARAVASEPRCLLLDEPISSLDAKSRDQMCALLRKIHRRGRQLIVHVTHDYTEAVSLGTHVAVMEAGTIAQVGTVDEILHRPKSEFVAQFVGIRNFFKGRLEAPDSGQANLKWFRSDGLGFSVLTDSPGGSGFICVPSEDVAICSAASRTGARNSFEGMIIDIAPCGGGVEVMVDIGSGHPMEVTALVAAESAKALDLRCGKKVRVSFKASAARYIEE